MKFIKINDELINLNHIKIIGKENEKHCYFLKILFDWNPVKNNYYFRAFESEKDRDEMFEKIYKYHSI